MYTYTDVCLRTFPRLRPLLRNFLKVRGLEYETYGEDSLGRPKWAYVTVRNIATSEVAELRRFGKILIGYPYSHREYPERKWLLADPAA